MPQAKACQDALAGSSPHLRLFQEPTRPPTFSLVLLPAKEECSPFPPQSQDSLRREGRCFLTDCNCHQAGQPFSKIRSAEPVSQGDENNDSQNCHKTRSQHSRAWILDGDAGLRCIARHSAAKVAPTDRNGTGRSARQRDEQSREGRTSVLHVRCHVQAARCKEAVYRGGLRRRGTEVSLR